MADNLLEMLKGQMTGAIQNQLLGSLGLSSSNGGKVLESAAATMLSGLALKTKQPGGSDQIMDMLRNNKLDGSLLDNLGGVLGSPQKTEEIAKQGGGMLDSIFGGNKLTAILSMLGGLFGLGSGVMGKVMGMLAPIVLSQVGKIVMGRGMGAQGLTDLMASQIPFLKNAAPPGLGNVLGFADLGTEVAGKVGDYARSATTAATSAATTTARAADGGLGKILPWIAAGLLGLAALYWLTQRGAQPVVEEPADVARVEGGEGTVVKDMEPAVDSETTIVEPAAAVPRMLTLPGLGELQIPAGFEVVEQIVSHIQTPDADLSKTFPLDALKFASGATAPAEDAMPGVSTLMDLLAKVLGAFPNANVKIVGYTDDTAADEAAQKAEALARAEAVKGMMTKLGIDPARVAVEGIGKAEGDLTTDEAKAKARRIDFGVTKL